MTERIALPQTNPNIKTQNQNFSGKTLPLLQGNPFSHNLSYFLEKCLELRHRIFSIVGNSQGMCSITHIKVTPTWLRWAKT